jgi:hypothetical protein
MLPLIHRIQPLKGEHPMAKTFNVLSYRDLTEAHAFIRDSRDEREVYLVDEGADLTEHCIRGADGRWRNPLPPLVDRECYLEALGDEEFENELADADEQLVEGVTLNDLALTADRVDSLNEDPLVADPSLPARLLSTPAPKPLRSASHRSAVAANGSRIDAADGADLRKPTRSWKHRRIIAQYAKHGA